LKRVKRIFMTGEAGYHNLGDEGMALASARRLRHYFPDAELVATGLDLYGSVLRHQARIVPWPLLPGDIRASYLRRLIRKYAQKVGASEDFLDPFARPFELIFRDHYRTDTQFRAAVEEIEQADLVFDMGHGALNDIFSPFMLCFVYYLAGKFGKPLFISGQSIGPLWRRSSLEMMKHTLPFAHTIGLRDIGVSKEILVRQVGLVEQQVRMVEVGDDTLDLDPVEPDWSHMPARVSEIIRSREFIAVQWRGTDYSQVLRETAQIMPSLELLEVAHRQTNLPLVFVPLSWEEDGDVLIAARIYDYLGGRLPFYVLWNYVGAPQIKFILGHARLGIGSSYHFHVFSLSQGVPTIALYTNEYYRIKLNSAMAAFGHKIAPVFYPPRLEDLRHLTEALDCAVNWNEVDRASLLQRAEATRQAWHLAWERFMADNQLA
jgi:polysaccharide pyruvyl transferase WcaK-like protein